MSQVIPFFIRGETVASPDLYYESSGGKYRFHYPDPSKHFNRIVLDSAGDLHRSFADCRVRDIIDFLAAVGKRLHLESNVSLQQALNNSLPFSKLPRSIMEYGFSLLPIVFSRLALTSLVEGEIGSRYLDDWVELVYAQQIARVRAYGCRTLHFLSGNFPAVPALSLARALLTKGDHIFRLPPNDPLTTHAILTTMADVDPEHPCVRHVSTIFWDPSVHADLERNLMTTRYLEKVISWGGALGGAHAGLGHGEILASGLEIIDLKPRFSVSCVGTLAFEDEGTMEQVARLAAKDAAIFNQESCGAARYIYVQTSPEQATQFGQMLYQFMQQQDKSLSTVPPTFPTELAEQIDALRIMPDWYEVIGGQEGEGAVIVDTDRLGVDLFPTDKVVIVVPVEHFEEVTLSPSVQTVGVWPDSLRHSLYNHLIGQGAVRFVSLGHTVDYAAGGPFNSVRIMSQAVRWILDEQQPGCLPGFYLRKALQIAFAQLGVTKFK